MQLSRAFGEIVPERLSFHQLHMLAAAEAKEFPKLDGSGFRLDGVMVLVSVKEGAASCEELYQLFNQHRTPGVRQALKMIGPTLADGVQSL